ncbi:MarR family winged helix-turn-helix transcriptional regulator [Rugosimonospora acidiphila]|uniref:MarR family winged helix-turn-helix transcriptional regulator n=1 Tax=Rugosimonospora acidiphila TaxID=556531 RepID=UPI0031F05C17
MINPEPGGTSEGLAEDLLATLGLMRRHLRRRAGRPWPSSPLTTSQVELARLVRHNPGISVAEAAGELGLVPNTVSTLVGQLSEQGLLRRSPDPNDRRVARLTLTPPAQQQVNAWRDRRIALVTQVLERLDDRELDALRTALPTLNAVAERLRSEGADDLAGDGPDGDNERESGSEGRTGGRNGPAPGDGKGASRRTGGRAAPDSAEIVENA